jgi:hypothetical protein
LHIRKWSNGKKKKGWKPQSSKNNSIEDSVGNEEKKVMFEEMEKPCILL